MQNRSILLFIMIQPARLLTINAPSICDVYAYAYSVSVSVSVSMCVRPWVYACVHNRIYGYRACVNSFMVLLLLLKSTADWELFMYNIYVYMYTQFIFLFIAALLCFAFSDGFVCYKKTTTTTTTIIKLSTNRDQLMLYSIFACCLQLFVEPNVYRVYTTNKTCQISSVCLQNTPIRCWLCLYYISSIGGVLLCAKSSFLCDFFSFSFFSFPLLLLLCCCVFVYVVVTAFISSRVEFFRFAFWPHIG